MSDDDKQTVSDWIDNVNGRLDTLETAVQEVKTNTSAVVEAFEAAQGAFKVLEWVGKIVRPIAWIAGIGTFGAVVVNKFSATAVGRFLSDHVK
jgi:hypothetical protein